jgi:hypothetical protein
MLVTVHVPLASSCHVHADKNDASTRDEGLLHARPSGPGWDMGATDSFLAASLRGDEIAYTSRLARSEMFSLTG